MKKLELSTFKTIVANTPLISIDLVVKNNLGQVLLGKRLNKPAQDFWFVPGGRILKDETIANAFSRLVQQELGVICSIADGVFLGNYEHFYANNFSGDDFSTHYVVLAYEINVNLDLAQLPIEQHNQYQWFTVSQLLTDPKVHQNTKNYF